MRVIQLKTRHALTSRAPAGALVLFKHLEKENNTSENITAHVIHNSTNVFQLHHIWETDVNPSRVPLDFVFFLKSSSSRLLKSLQKRMP